MRIKQLKKKYRRGRKPEEADQGGTDLVRLILSWSIRDILNKDLYKEKVKKIPEIFSSTADYLNSFMYPLIEEIHADLYSALENAPQAPVCEVTWSTMTQVWPPEYSISTRRTVFINHHDEQHYRPKSGDVLLLTNSRLKKVEDLNTLREAFLMAFVLGNEKQFRFCNYHIRTSKAIDNHLIPREPKTLTATYMINLTTNMRIWEVLKRNPQSPNLNLIKSVLHYDSSEQNDCSIGFSEEENVTVSDLISSFSLDESQKSAILSSIPMKNCSHNSGCSKVKLIWGPPGTGKTKTVASLLFALLKLKCRTLTCAPTNIAVVQVVKRLMDLVLRSPDKYGNCRVGDILLLGDAGRMKTVEHDDIAKAFLSNRVQKLSTYIREWRSSLHSIRSLLSNPEDGYNKAREKSTEKNFYTLAETLMLCANNLFIHLPTACIPLGVETDTITLVEQLKKLESARKIVNHFDELLIESANELCIRLDIQFPGLTFKDEKKEWENMRRLCLANACLLFCTASHSINVATNVEMVIIDEAAQLKESESIIPLRIPGVKNAVLVGDDRQLPAMVQSKVSANANFGRSLFQRLATLGKEKHLLNIQYRMHPSISLFPNEKIYENKIIDAPHVKEISYQRSFLDGAMFGPYSFINVEKGKESFSKEHSPCNMGEADVIVQIIAKLFKGHFMMKQKVSVGIISPYKGQVGLIQEKIGMRYAKFKETFAVKIHSVDGFQGGEEDIIIISTVRCNQNGSVGFNSNHQRTNVALTRARYCLWIVGNEATLAESGSIWKDLVIDAKTRGCFHNADGNIDLKAVIRKSAPKLKCSDSLELGNTRWKVLFTEDFKISVASISKKSQQQVQAMLKKIADGWRQSNSEEMESVAIDGVAAEILKQYKVDEQLYLIWTVDVLKEESKYTQIIKVWDILPASKIPKLAEELNILFGVYTVNFMNCCKHKSFQGNLAVPMSWPLHSVVRAKHLSTNAANINLPPRKRGSVFIDERETKLRRSLRRRQG